MKEIFFNGGVTVDNIKINNAPSDYDDLKNLQESTNEFETSTIFLNNFSGDLELTLSAQYVTSGLATNRFDIYRKTPSDKSYQFLLTLKNGASGFTDFNVKNNTYYSYLINTNINNGSEKIVLRSKTPFKTHWRKWSICNIEYDEYEDVYFPTGDTWLFSNNLSSGEISQNNSITTWETLGKYAKVSVGNKNYDSGSISCLLGDMKKFTNVNFVALGSELLTNTILASGGDLTNWTSGVGWSYSSGALHTVGNTADLVSPTFSATKARVYQVEWTITDRTAGSVAIKLGTVNLIETGMSTAFTGSNKKTVIANTTGNVSLTITPTTDFNGKISALTVKLLSTTDTTKYSEGVFYNETGIKTNEDCVNLVEYPYENPSKKIENWKNFCNDGKLKLLKDLSGEKWIVQILEKPSRKTNDNSQEQVKTISFSWIEIKNSDNIVVVDR